MSLCASGQRPPPSLTGSISWLVGSSLNGFKQFLLKSSENLKMANTNRLIGPMLRNWKGWHPKFTWKPRINIFIFIKNLERRYPMTESKAMSPYGDSRLDWGLKRSLHWKCFKYDYHTWSYDPFTSSHLSSPEGLKQRCQHSASQFQERRQLSVLCWDKQAKPGGCQQHTWDGDGDGDGDSDGDGDGDGDGYDMVVVIVVVMIVD